MGVDFSLERVVRVFCDVTPDFGHGKAHAHEGQIFTGMTVGARLWVWEWPQDPFDLPGFPAQIGGRADMAICTPSVI